MRMLWIALAAAVLTACGGGVTVADDEEDNSTLCTGYDEPESVTSATIRVTNTRSDSVYFNICMPLFEVVTDGVAQPGHLASWFMGTCADVLATGDFACCGCEISQEELAPGATKELAWNGLS